MKQTQRKGLQAYVKPHITQTLDRMKGGGEKQTKTYYINNNTVG